MEDFVVLTDVLPEAELLYWIEQVNSTFTSEGEAVQSTAMPPEQYEHTSLFERAVALSGGLPLIHALLFNIVKGMDTELHQDIGEWCVCFYPVTNAGTPLHTKDKGDVPLVANSLVAFDCTKYAHQQVVPLDDSHRFSVVFKFRKPVT